MGPFVSRATTTDSPLDGTPLDVDAQGCVRLCLKVLAGPQEGVIIQIGSMYNGLIGSDEALW